MEHRQCHFLLEFQTQCTRNKKEAWNLVELREQYTLNEKFELSYHTDAEQSVYNRYQQYIEITTKIRHNALQNSSTVNV
jgi:NAD-dependent SIR2 family protein deacetylase